MNAWLITTGSSDVQVKDADVWADWYPQIKKSLYGIDRRRFTPTRTIDDDGVPYRIPSRVLGLAYAALGTVVMEQLEFPLLQEFQRQLEDQQVAIAQIILLISDQSEVFDTDERDSYHCPYWQDTCLLYPILAAQLQTQFPTAQVTSLLLKPALAQEGLDNWNQVLTLVQQQIATLTIEPETVYVSHQAGTPAISSAVQFTSLAKFGDRVKFLVSNEYKSGQTDLIGSSSYLRGIRLQEVQALLKRYDYSGIKQLLDQYLDSTNPNEKRIKKLLAALIDWNFAEFHKFKNKLSKIEGFSKEAFPWWQLGYESAYLAVVRLNQGNTVDAIFHSFRAVEGLLRLWVDKHHSQIRQTPHSDPKREYFNNYGKDLYLFLEMQQPIDRKKDVDIWVFGHHVFDQRNKLFHQLEGLQDKKEVFEIWQSPNEKKWDEHDEEQWKNRLLNCLNFIAAVDLPQPFHSLEDASLMTEAHQALASAIAQL